MGLALLLHQIEIVLIVAAMLVLFVTERLRYDVIGALALLAAVATGCLPEEKAFLGFSNPVIIIIASVLVLSRAIETSGVLDETVRLVIRRLKSPASQIGFMVACVTVLSSFVKNIGALSLFLPVATECARRAGRTASIYLMPLAFGSLIGGTITQIGTSPNLLISTVRRDLGGEPFQMFDFTPVGLPLAALAILFLSFGWRLLPRDRVGLRSPGQVFDIKNYMAELRLPPGCALIGKTVREVEEDTDGELGITAITPEGAPRFVPHPNRRLQAGDILTVRADPPRAKKFADANKLKLVGTIDAARIGAGDLDVTEAIVTANSIIAGKTVLALNLRRRYRVSLIAISRSWMPIQTRLRDHVFQPGDVIVLQGSLKDMPDTLAQLGCLPLADRGFKLSRKGSRYIPLLALAAAAVLILIHVLAVDAAFFAAAVAMVLFKQVTPKEAYDSIDWPIIVMLGSLIPVGMAFNETGAAQTIAQLLVQAAAYVPSLIALGAVLLLSMLVAPLMHHAAAVLVMGPIAAAIAKDLTLNADPFLMAVALGASCDFLTPIGHQNNTLVMGAGGYHFGDYWRLGLPLSLLVILAGTPLIAWVWPLSASG